MSYKVLASMNIAVIGAGAVGKYYASAFATVGHEVFLARKNGDDSAIPAELEMHEHVTVCSIEDAADVADIIVVATPPKDVREVSYWLGDVRRKVIIDVTANVHSSEDDLVKTVCAIKAITGSQHIIKVFNTRGYERLLKPFFSGVEVQYMMLSSCRKAREITRIMLDEIGLVNFSDFGGEENVPLFNETTRVWRKLLLEQRTAKTPGVIVRN